jgi:hypothetical protein
MSYSFNQTIEQAKKEYGLNKGEYLKIQEGDNRIRVLSACIPHQGEYKGTPTFKFVAWVIDRRDGVIKPYFMPMTVMNAIGSLQTDPDYGFEDVPMPYDINVKAQDAGTKEVVYNVVPSPKQTPITDEELTELNSRLPIEKYVEKLKEQKKSSPDGSQSVTEGSVSEEQVKHIKNLMNMKGIDEAGLIDLGIPLDKMTAETYEEYVKVLRDEPFRKKVNGDDLSGDDIPFN